MKPWSKITLAAAAVALCGAALSPVGKIDRPAPAYNPEQTKGNVRVVLLRLDRTTVFTDDGFSNTNHTHLRAVPGWSVVYLVEPLGSEVVSNLHGGWANGFVNGKALSESSAEDVVGGGTGGVQSYSSYHWEHAIRKPQVQDPKRAFIREQWHRGERIPGDKLELRISAGFNSQIEEFIFHSVPAE